MLRVFTQGLHPNFLTTILSPSLQGYLPAVWFILAEGQVQSLTEVSDPRVRILGETLELQGRSKWSLSRCGELSISLINLEESLCLLFTSERFSGCHGVLGPCLVIWNEWSSDVTEFWLSYAALGVVGSWLSYFYLSKRHLLLFSVHSLTQARLD